MTPTARRDGPRFTVLMPTHNRADVLPLAIRSVLAQDDSDFELLVVADGCTDDTASVVAAFDDPRLRFLDLPKAPFYGYANRNIAMAQATGGYVAYAPHDDLLFPDHLRRLGDLLDSTGAALAYSLPVWVSTDGVAVPIASDLSYPDQMARFQAHHNTIPAACVMHRRDLYDGVAGWPETVASAADWVLWRRMLDRAGHRLAYLPVPTSLHFSAAWKAARGSLFPPLDQGLSIVDRVGWWPSILRQPPVAGGREQEPYASAMTRGGLAWAATFRAAVESVVGRLSWMLLDEVGPEAARLGEALEATRVALQESADRVAGLTTERQGHLARSAERDAAARDLRQAIVSLERQRDEAALARDRAKRSADDARSELDDERVETAKLRDALKASAVGIEGLTTRWHDAEQRVVAADIRAADLQAAVSFLENERAAVGDPVGRAEVDAARLSSERERTAAAVALATDLRASIDALLGSASWRWTAPLRGLRRLVPGRRRRPRRGRAAP